LNIDSIRVPKEYITSVMQNIENNRVVLDYYHRLAEEFQDLSSVVSSKFGRMSDCNSFWELDVYDVARIKDFIRTNLCKDKFCSNCKKVKQASRMARFMPYIEQHKQYGLYQLVLTVPNVPGCLLRPTIDRMFKSFARLIEYFKGKKKIRGLDFERYGYLGAIRSLEVTYGSKGFHPHIHALICMTGDQGEKAIENKYSIDHFGNRQKRLFSFLEVLIQKIWYLLMNGQRVTLKAINDLPEGYSCMMDKFKEEDFLELFKYMTKAKEEDNSVFTYRNFKFLYFHLENVRQIQGYGCFFRIKDEDMEEEVDELYNALIQSLGESRKSVERPSDLLFDGEYTLISRKKVYQYLRRLNVENEKESFHD
jgi:plasmid rolling circle replication initiator protein Rep